MSQQVTNNIFNSWSQETVRLPFIDNYSPTTPEAQGNIIRIWKVLNTYHMHVKKDNKDGRPEMSFNS